jgi:Antitoxin VbhA
MTADNDRQCITVDQQRRWRPAAGGGDAGDDHRVVQVGGQRVVRVEAEAGPVFRAGLAGVQDRVRRSLEAAAFVGAHGRAVSAGQYEALQEAAERQRAVAAALASVRAQGLQPSAQDLALFAEVAGGRLSTDELRERVFPLPLVSSAAGDPYLDPASGVLPTCSASPMQPNSPGPRRRRPHRG